VYIKNPKPYMFLACSHVAGASGEAWKQGNVDFTGVKVKIWHLHVPAGCAFVIPVGQNLGSCCKQACTPGLSLSSSVV